MFDKIDNLLYLIDYYNIMDCGFLKKLSMIY